MKVKLKDICVSITDGDHQPPPKASDGIPFITISNINKEFNTLDFDNSAFVPNEYYRSLSEERKPKQGDILYSVVGSFGIPVLLRDDRQFVFQRHIAILRPNAKVVPAYLHYLMRSRDFNLWAANVAIGAAQKTITLGQLRNKEIELPPIEQQSRIVGILLAYDELIENNRKQIKLLEEAAQRLYKEWFIDLHFPNHETTPTTNGLPEGWQQKSILDVVSFVRGKSYQSHELTNVGEYLLINLGNISPFGGYRSGYEKRYSGMCREDQFVNTGNIVMGVTEQAPGLAGYVALVPLLRRKALISMDLIRLIPKKIENEYIYAFFRWGNGSRLAASYANGAKVRHLKPDTLRNVQVIIPTDDLQKRFGHFLNIIIKKENCLASAIDQLTEARNRLLPKLMNPTDGVLQ